MTHDELENYINNFKPNVRETVYKQIMDSDLLERAFSTNEGKQILDNAVDSITSNVMTIISNSKGDDAAIDEVCDCAKGINITYKLMYEWAKILVAGSEHKDKIK